MQIPALRSADALLHHQAACEGLVAVSHRVDSIQEVRITNVDFIGRWTNDRPVLAVQLFQGEGKLTASEVVVGCGPCREAVEPWAGNMAQGVEEQALEKGIKGPCDESCKYEPGRCRVDR